MRRFRVGRLICAQCDLRYVGVDAVPDLIAYNRSRFGGPQVEFRCTNLIDDELPDGELCLIRQVLQHLSNAEISRVLAKCAKYQYVYGRTVHRTWLASEPGYRTWTR